MNGVTAMIYFAFRGTKRPREGLAPFAIRPRALSV